MSAQVAETCQIWAHVLEQLHRLYRVDFMFGWLHPSVALSPLSMRLLNEHEMACRFIAMSWEPSNQRFTDPEPEAA